jgi:hypothetical protein
MLFDSPGESALNGFGLTRYVLYRILRKTGQAATMFDIYRSSYFNIAALAASDCSQGLFSLRNPLLLLPCELKIGSASFTRPPRNLAPWPLNTRGWVFQERLLATRTVSFGLDVNWSCLKRCGSHNILDRSDFYRRPDPARFFKSSSLLDIEPQDVKDFQRTWHFMVEEYTGLHLTFPRDRLAAISGIITMMERRRPWKNRWGLWEPFFMHDLLWICRNSTAEPTGAGPSWS